MHVSPVLGCCRCLLERYHTLYSLPELLQSCPACRKACACSSCLRDAASAELVPPLQPEPLQQARQAQYVLRELLPHLASMVQQQEAEVRTGVWPWWGGDVAGSRWLLRQAVFVATAAAGGLTFIWRLG